MVKKNNKKSSSKSLQLISMNGINNIINTNTKSMKKYFRNNYELIKSVFSFIIAIGLIVVLYNVYKYYKDGNGINNINLNNVEGFEQAEPYDLLDKVKSDIYRLDTIWNNQLYNFQKEKRESPLAFWEITKQDSAYKVIGHAVNNEIDTLKDNQPIAPKNKTMLVDGDTRPPMDVKLIYSKNNNLITTKFKNDSGDLLFHSEYINIKTPADITNRLNILERLFYKVENINKKIENEINNIVSYQANNLTFKTHLYAFDNYFKNPNVKLYSKLGEQVKSVDGKYNCARIPLGCNVTFTFNNGKSINFNHDYNSILNSDKTSYIILDNYNVFKQTDGSMFQYMNYFDIFGEYGMNQKNNSLKTGYEGKISPKRKRILNYPYNYSVSNNSKNGTGNLKTGLFDYINNKINNNETRKKFIKGFNSDDQEPIVNVIFSKNTDDDKEQIAYITTNPVGNTFKHYYNTTKDKLTFNNASKEVEISVSSTNDDGVEGFEDLKNNKVYKIPNSRIHVDESDLSFKIDLSGLLKEIDDEFSNFEKEEWFANLLNNINSKSDAKDTGTSIISKLLNFNSNKYITFNNSILTINSPAFYLDFTFNYPSNTSGWDRRNNCIGIDKAHPCKYSEVKGTHIGYISHDHDKYIPLHNDPKISSLNNKDEEFYLKSISVKSGYTIDNHPIFKIINTFKNDIISIFSDIKINIAKSAIILNKLRNDINFNELKHYPMKIYRPIAPKYYKSVGDLIYAETSLFKDDPNFVNSKPNLSQIACVPEQCVREVREWLPVDKIYEYQKGGEYLAIFKNPYLQTFRAVTTPGTLPSGKVEKVVACVERCKLIDDIIQADKCAKTFYKTHKNISDTFNMDPDNVINERKNQIYKNKIVERQDRINMLKETARRLQVQDDKANLINEAYNRNKLQDLVDKQNANMHKLVNKLEKGRNKIAIRVKFNYDKLFQLCSNGDLPNDVCSYVQENIRKPSNLTDAERRQYDTNMVAALLDSCPTPESEGLVKRALVENNCGCYFTDEELETTN